MELVSNGDSVLNYLTDDNSLISSTLFRIDLYCNDSELRADLYFTLPYANQIKLMIRLINISEVGFYFNTSHFFYQVTNCKLFRQNDFFYLSLDPDESDPLMSVNDQDFFWCRDIEVYTI
jgi:hypothetical protein